MLRVPDTNGLHEQSPPLTPRRWYLHKSRRDDLVKPGVKPRDRDFAVHQAAERRPEFDEEFRVGRSSGA